MDIDYANLLKKARNEMPESIFIKERFEIPKVMGHIEGNKTIITNFVQIAGILRRPIDHMVKYVVRELGAPGGLKGSLLIIGTKIPASRVNEKVRQYANEFVLCNECGKPDTKLQKEGSITYMKCAACGSRHQVRSRI